MPVPYFVSPEWMIDGTGSANIKNAMIRIQDQTIFSITDSRESKKKDLDTSAFNILDLQGFTVLPCLVDSHVHLTMSGTTDAKNREGQLVAGYAETVERIQHHLREDFRYGVLAVRDGGDKKGYTLRFRDRGYDPSRAPHVSIRFAGKAWHQSGRYGSLIGRPPGDNQTLAESMVMADEEVDVIKIVNSGLNSLRKFGRQTLPQFSVTEFKSLIHAAKQRGKKVMVHANGTDPVSISIDAGCDSVEHGFFMGRENLKKMAEKGVTWVPTAVTMKAYSQLMKSDQTISKVCQKNLDQQLEQLQQAREYGVRVAVGTDAGSPGVDHGRAVLQEMALFMKAGYSLEEAVMCATSVGAELLGLKKIGRLTPGMCASFLVVPGNPSQLPDSLNAIEMIYMNGNLVYEKSKRQ